MTIDTNCVINAAQRGPYVTEVADLIALAQVGKLGLSLTSAFEVDQERAKEANRALNLQWLRELPVIARTPQPWRFDFSPVGDPGHAWYDVDADGALVTQLEDIILPPQLRPGQFNPTDADLQSRFRRKVADVQHLAGHLMNGNDYFVTTDFDDMLRKRDRIRAATGIRVVDPPEAVQIGRGGAAPGTP